MSGPLRDGAHPDLVEEQRFLLHAYACLDAMRQRAIRLKNLGYMGGNVHAETGLTPEMAAYWELDRQARVDSLSDSAAPLCFGRIDHGEGASWHIGRRHVEDEGGAPVVTDWRATVAAPFYRATVADPMGLRRRRHFLIDARELFDIFDEDLEHPTERDAGAYVPDPLLAEVGRHRTGQMRDIVATIQAEQDAIIRAGLEECIVVQGGPGTGKTAVGLHRAAYLLYQHRERLERQRLLIVGPNRLFLRYIAQVLPSLGEVASTQLTLEGLAGTRYSVRAEESAALARLKGDARMAAVVRRAVLAQITRPTEDLRIPTRYGAVIVPAAHLAELVEAGMARQGRVRDYREVLRRRIVGLAWGRQVAKPTATVTDRLGFETDAGGAPELKAALDRMWPTVSAAGVLRRLYGHGPTRVAATAGLLSTQERDALARSASGRIAVEPWTRADLALLDEAEDVILGVSQRYGHVVVDEAQDLSAMELRMIARRAIAGSMTVLGDLAQATAPGAQTDWRGALDTLGAPQARYEELTVGYRVPEPILEFANRLLPEAAPGLRPSTSVRSAGPPPRIVRVSNDEVASTVAREVEGLSALHASIGVVVPSTLKEPVATALRSAGVDFIDGQRTLSLGDHVTLLPPTETKGVEFDSVVVVEPGRIVGEHDGNLRLLYVVLTRAVQTLTVVHAEPLPSSLTPDGGAVTGSGAAA
jgi:DNA helicase IV